MCALPNLSWAQSGSTSSDIGAVLSISLSLFLVIGLIFGLAYVMRRFTGVSSGNGQMKVVSSMMAGTKERIMVLQVGKEQHLIGVTSHAINHLATLAEPLEQTAPAGLTSAANSSHAFKDKLVQAMASRMQGNKNKAGKNED